MVESMYTQVPRVASRAASISACCVSGGVMDSEIRDDVEHPGTPAAETLSAVPVAVGFERKVRRRAWWSAAKEAGVYALFGRLRSGERRGGKGCVSPGRYGG